ncbi:hypothetical protein SEA_REDWATTLEHOG_209 [Gordonia phage RedWattleHog]|uniref:Uncharacterized protein n=1 Tax=Gordonia phage Stormageddon TaxID=2656541 RepID=A0A649VRC0_9CAUD|nr:hypothetical protein KHQ86_gp090 [Gordonia phage Stormageddon]QGJ95070.1 hypothetical protein SEA_STORMAGEDDON_210 [Gordonia phage Stormageddon]QLF83712.1 hypothetical protein SEA_REDWATTLEHOG_209 [Gordonia phage RedWattleHog]
MSIRWEWDNGSMVATEGDFRLRVNSSVTSGYGGFIYHKSDMVFSDTYTTIGQAQRDLEARLADQRYRLREPVPEAPQGVGQIAPGYVLDQADVAAIEYVQSQVNP